MRKSQRVRSSDVAAVERLFSGLDHLPPDDPAARFRHLLDGLRALLDCPHTGVWLRPISTDPAVLPGPMRFFEQSGLTPGQRADFHKLFVANPDARRDPLLTAARPRFRPTTPFTYRRDGLVPDADWYRSPYVAGFRRPMGFDHTLTSAVRVGGGLVFAVGGWHEWGGPAFGDRSQALLHHVAGRLGWLTAALIARPHPGGALPLSPRERDTLRRLLAGRSEKEAAADLGVSPRTVHEYVTALYRKFGVSTRAELMARWMPPADGSHEIEDRLAAPDSPTSDT